MSLMLHMQIKNAEGALERILGVIRFRGYQLQSIMATPSREENRLEVDLTLGGGHRSPNLVNQLAKVFDVVSVEIYSAVKNVNAL